MQMLFKTVIISTILIFTYGYSFAQWTIQKEIEYNEKEMHASKYKIDSLATVLAEKSHNLQSSTVVGNTRNSSDSLDRILLYLDRDKVSDKAYLSLLKSIRHTQISLEVDVESGLQDVEYYNDQELMRSDPHGVEKYLTKEQEKRIKNTENLILSSEGKESIEPETGTGLNLTLSLPFIAVPIYENTSLFSSAANQSSSYSFKNGMIAYAGVTLDGELYLLRNAFVNLMVNFKGTYTNTGLFSELFGETSQTNTYYDFQGGGTLYLGVTKVKALGEYIYGHRFITYESSTGYDFGTTGTASTVSIYNADYSFSRMAGGLKVDLRRGDKEEENFIQVKYIIDNLKSNGKTEKPWGIGLLYRNWMTISASYFPDYPVSGKPMYPLQDEKKKESFWYVSIGRAFAIF